MGLSKCFYTHTIISAITSSSSWHSATKCLLYPRTFIVSEYSFNVHKMIIIKHDDIMKCVFMDEKHPNCERNPVRFVLDDSIHNSSSVHLGVKSLTEPMLRNSSSQKYVTKLTVFHKLFRRSVPWWMEVNTRDTHKLSDKQTHLVLPWWRNFIVRSAHYYLNKSISFMSNLAP